MSGLVNKKSLTEADIRTKYITPRCARARQFELGFDDSSS